MRPGAPQTCSVCRQLEPARCRATLLHYLHSMTTSTYNPEGCVSMHTAGWQGMQEALWVRTWQ
jgi:hypothetical protein